MEGGEALRSRTLAMMATTGLAAQRIAATGTLECRCSEVGFV